MIRHPRALRTVAHATMMVAVLATTAAADPEIDRAREELDAAKARLAQARQAFDQQEQRIIELTTRIASLRAKVEQGMSAEGVLQPPPDTPPPPTTVTQVPDNFITEVTPYVVVIEGDQGSGTGFLCHTGGQVWVYTAAHVLSGNSRIVVRDSKGRKYKAFDFIECAEGVDLVRLRPTNQDLQGLELASSTEIPETGDIIAAVGNSLGAGALSAEAGTVTDIQDDMWEVDAAIIPGNSGGPVISLQNRKVIGIVTHLIIKRYNHATERNQENRVKRFAARLDKQWEWRRMDITRFVKEWKYIETMKRDSAVGWAAAHIMHVRSTGRSYSASTRGRRRNDDTTGIAEQIIRDEADHIHVKRMAGWLRDYQDVTRVNRSELISKGNAIVNQIIEDLRLKGNEPKPEHFSWFHREEYESQLKWRKEMTDG